MITIENLKIFEQIDFELTEVCKEWAKKNLDNGCKFTGWARSSRGYIGIHYSYKEKINNIESETCYAAKLVSWEDLVEFAKILEL